MTSPQISLAMLARTAYRPVGQAMGQPGGQNLKAEATPFQAEPVRRTVKTSPSVQIELSDAARSALLGLQEIAAAPAPKQKSPPPMTNTYVQPGARLNLSV
ncbi:hypothetical protein MNBD_ALPHA04-572 [hydrothermal vent metagenome]|uniref:Uncharacterized protein n=1 Tax=hydrothermal vent metagenome TaxID=652676 RepID=A0A3B0SYN8_9ZZZZ